MPTRCSLPSTGWSASDVSPRSRSWLAHGGTQWVICALDDETVAHLVQALWVIAETWLAFGELDGNPTDAQDSTRLLRVVLQPYLSPVEVSLRASERLPSG